MWLGLSNSLSVWLNFNKMAAWEWGWWWTGRENASVPWLTHCTYCAAHRAGAPPACVWPLLLAAALAFPSGTRSSPLTAPWCGWAWPTSRTGLSESPGTFGGTLRKKETPSAEDLILELLVDIFASEDNTEKQSQTLDGGGRGRGRRERNWQRAWMSQWYCWGPRSNSQLCRTINFLSFFVTLSFNNLKLNESWEVYLYASSKSYQNSHCERQVLICQGKGAPPTPLLSGGALRTGDSSDRKIGSRRMRHSPVLL